MRSKGTSDVERRRPRSDPSDSAGRPLKYGDRFRPGYATLELEPIRSGDLVDQEDRRPRQRWPVWLTRGAAGVGVVATAVIAVTVGDGSEPATPAPSETPRAVSLPINDRPPVAPLEVGLIEADVWDSRGFSYEITMTNRSDTAFDLIDVGPKMSGTELAWDRELVLHPGRVIRTDVAVLYVGDEAEKQALLLGEPAIFFTTHEYDGWPLVLARLDAVDLQRLEELVVDAWRMRAPRDLIERLGADAP